MAILKKIRSATLIEALIATILIVIVFVVASLVLNNLLFNTFSRNTHAVENRIFELQYSVMQNSIVLPYKEQFDKWDIELTQEQFGDNTLLKSKAINSVNKKEIVKSIIYESN